MIKYRCRNEVKTIAGIAFFMRRKFAKSQSFAYSSLLPAVT
jgi:hypothetical protein